MNPPEPRPSRLITAPADGYTIRLYPVHGHDRAAGRYVLTTPDGWTRHHRFDDAWAALEDRLSDVLPAWRLGEARRNLARLTRPDHNLVWDLEPVPPSTDGHPGGVAYAILHPAKPDHTTEPAPGGLVGVADWVTDTTRATLNQAAA